MTAHGWTPAPVAVRGDATGSHWETTRPAPAQAGADSWCTVRVRGPRGGVDVALPASQTVAETVDELAARLLPGAPLGRPGETWYLHRLGRPPFHPSARLVEVDLRDGESLHLSPHPMPRPAQPVDDGLVALAEGAARAPRWSPTAVTFVLAFCASDSWSGCIGVRRRLDAVAKLNASPNGARSIFEGSEGLRADAWPQTDVPRPMLSVRRFAAASLTRMSQSARGVPRTVAPLIATTCRVMNLQRGRTVKSAGGRLRHGCSAYK